MEFSYENLSFELSKVPAKPTEWYRGKRDQIVEELIPFRILSNALPM